MRIIRFTGSGTSAYHLATIRPNGDVTIKQVSFFRSVAQLHYLDILGKYDGRLIATQ